MPGLIATLLERAADNPSAVALIDDRGVISYGTLARRAAGLARGLPAEAGRLGILAGNGIDWVVADLACKMAGRGMVPLPSFFSDQQRAHVARDSGIGAVLTDARTRPLADSLGLPVLVIEEAGEAEPDPDSANASWEQIVYTSGTTGTPKGVRLGADQVEASAAALAEAVGATSDDRYLSVLPFSLLLEQICALYIPLLVGAASHIGGDAADACLVGRMGPLLEAVARHRPNVMVLVPQLLAGWVAALTQTKGRAPASLRFVAVGGAHVPPGLAEAARGLGIPVHEGYGLSECCSVVAVNRPGERKPGTVGKPLPGLDVTIEDGEIVVAGPTVMAGYLGRDGTPAGSWRTGDLGAIDADGYLTVFGRKDTVIVTSNGRNISPEWIESLIAVDPRVGRCVVTGHGEAHTTALLTPSELGRPWFANAGPDEVTALVAGLCVGAPDYARPGRVVVAEESALHADGLIAANGRPQRDAIARHLSATSPDSEERRADS